MMTGDRADAAKRAEHDAARCAGPSRVSAKQKNTQHFTLPFPRAQPPARNQAGARNPATSLLRPTPAHHWSSVMSASLRLRSANCSVIFGLMSLNFSISSFSRFSRCSLGEGGEK